MATTTDAQGDRRLLVAAVGLLAAVTGVTFGRVFQGTHPAVRLAVAGMLAVAIGVLLERRHLGLSVLASAAGCIVTLGVLVFPGTTWAGIPGPDTLEAIAEALGRAGDRAAIEVAPAPALPSLMTAALIAVWATGAASHALAVRARATVLPLLPGAALLGFVGVVTREPPRPAYAVAFLTASFAVLFAEVFVHAGARMRPRPSAPVVSGRWARSLGAGAVLAALAVPGVLPGYRTEPVLQLGERGERVAVSPIVDIRPNLLRNPPASLFRVRASRAAYWRMVVLDQFDGEVWSASGLDRIEGPLLDGPSTLDGIPEKSGARLDQEFQIDELSTLWLPAASQPLAIHVDGELGARHDLDSEVLALDAPTDDDVRYRVTSATPAPTAAELDLIYPGDQLTHLQALPPQLPPRIREIALEVAAGAETPFRQVLAIQDHLRTFTYDERAPAGHGANAMLNFLEETQQGYCEQFAGAMAVMVRALRLPARVAIGFLPGDRDPGGAFRVTTGQVHAWPEVYFQQYGWIPFEPTPGRFNPNAGYLVELPGGGGDADPRDSAADARGGRQRFQRELETGLTAAREQPGADARPAARSPWRGLLPLGAAMVALAALVAVSLKMVRRRLAVRGADGPRDRVVAAYRWLLGGAADLGVGRRRGETPWEYRARLGRDGGVFDERLDRLTGVAARAMYSSRTVDQEQADDAVADARALLRELRREAGPVTRVVGVLRPGE